MSLCPLTLVPDGNLVAILFNIIYLDTLTVVTVEES